MSSIPSETRTTDSPYTADDGDPVGGVLQSDLQVPELLVIHTEIFDVAFFLQDLRNGDLHLGVGHLGMGVSSGGGIPDARQHVCYRVSGSHENGLPTSFRDAGNLSL